MLTLADSGRTQLDERAMAKSGMAAVFRIFELWDLNNDQATILLGRPSKATFHKWKRGEVGRLGHDRLTRLSYLLGIYKALQLLFKQPKVADAWLKKPNQAFQGQSALERMMAGEIVDLATVRSYLDAVRGDGL